MQKPENNPTRCFGNKPNQELYAKYHDTEWGVAKYDDKTLFEFLILEGAQAGLSWETVLKKREGYKEAFHDFNVEKIAQMTNNELDDLINNPNIIRNRLKIYSARKNAVAFIAIQNEFGSFSKYIWQFVDNIPIVNSFKNFSEIPTSTTHSDIISKDLKKRGMNFVGTTIIYAYMQAVGLVCDHLTSCCCYKNKID